MRWFFRLGLVLVLEAVVGGFSVVALRGDGVWVCVGFAVASVFVWCMCSRSSSVCMCLLCARDWACLGVTD